MFCLSNLTLTARGSRTELTRCRNDPRFEFGLNDITGDRSGRKVSHGTSLRFGLVGSRPGSSFTRARERELRELFESSVCCSHPLSLCVSCDTTSGVNQDLIARCEKVTANEVSTLTSTVEEKTCRTLWTGITLAVCAIWKQANAAHLKGKTKEKQEVSLTDSVKSSKKNKK